MSKTLSREESEISDYDNEEDNYYENETNKEEFCYNKKEFLQDLKAREQEKNFDFSYNIFLDFKNYIKEQGLDIGSEISSQKFIDFLDEN